MISPVVIGVLAALICVAGFIVLMVNRALTGNKKPMAKLAKSLGLPLIRGERAKPGRGLIKIGPWTYFILDLWKNRELNIYHIVKGSGKSRIVNAAMDVPVEVSPEFRLTVSTTGGFSDNGTMQSLSLVSSDDEAFDARFIVKSSDTDTAKRILAPELRDFLTNTWIGLDVRGSLSVREGRVHYEESGWIVSEAKRRRFLGMAEVCNRIADAVSTKQEASI